MKISVIVPTRDRAALLRRCLESLCEQSLAATDFEVIVVDNGSTDDTRQVAESFGKSLNLKYVFADEPGLHVGRHAGMRLASSSILTFADDDIEALPTWLASIVSSFADPKVSMVGGNNYPRFETDAPEWLLGIWNRRVGPGRALGTLSILDFGEGRFPIDPNYIWGCNFSVRKSVLEDAGGFHPDALPRNLVRFRGDGESHVSRFVAESDGIALFDSGASVYHFVPGNRMTPQYFETRSFAQGISDSYSELRLSNGRRQPGRILRGALKVGKWRALAAMRFLSAMISGGKRQIGLLEWSECSAYSRGRRFHRKEVLADHRLLDWVLRENYFEASIAKIARSRSEG